MAGGRCGILGSGRAAREAWTRDTERRRIIESFSVLSVPDGHPGVDPRDLDSDKWELVPALRRLHVRLGDVLADDLLSALPAGMTSIATPRLQRLAGERAILPHPARLRVEALRAGIRAAGVTMPGTAA